jgi:hypothetical protein
MSRRESNVSDHSATGFKVVAGDRRAVMALFDDMPPRLRQLYNYAPECLHPGEIWKYRNYPAQIEGAFWAKMREVFPDWHPRLEYDSVDEPAL